MHHVVTYQTTSVVIYHKWFFFLIKIFNILHVLFSFVCIDMIELVVVQNPDQEIYSVKNYVEMSS